MVQPRKRQADHADDAFDMEAMHGEMRARQQALAALREDACRFATF